jgi:cytochrome P450
MPNIYAMNIDPDCWEKPLEFNPRLHFLDEKGQLTRPQSFAPFGFGRRICIGEQLAKNDLFLIVVRLLQKVRLEPLDGVKYSLDYDLAQEPFPVPLPFSIKISPRQ